MSQASIEPTDLAALTARAGEHLSLGHRARRSALRRRLRAIGRAGVRRPRHVGEDRSQPAVQRLQVHPATARSAWPAAARRAQRCSPSRDTGIGIPRRGAAAPLRALSPRRGRARAARTKAPASVLRWSRNSCSCTAAAWRCTAAAARAPPSVCTFRSVTRTCRPSASARGSSGTHARGTHALAYVRGGARLARAEGSGAAPGHAGERRFRARRRAYQHDRAPAGAARG